MARERGFYSPELIHKITKAGSIQGFKEIPKEVRDVFVTAQDISPEWHIKMQSTLQKYVDNSISKTINFPWTASIRDVEEAYLLAWKAKCKGITINVQTIVHGQMSSCSGPIQFRKQNP